MITAHEKILSDRVCKSEGSLNHFYKFNIDKGFIRY